MAIIDISDDTADGLFRDMLVGDYRAIKRSITRLESRIDDLKDHEMEDLHNDLRILASMDVLLGYYLTEDDANVIRAEA